MLTVTFYSFRGGVGRTMALANVAAHLARSGLKVFLIDFDLEAPGLTLMPELQPANPPTSNEGLIGYLRAGLEDRELPLVDSLSYETALSRDIRQGSQRAESIHLLPAGTTRSPNRGQDLAHLHLERLYHSNERSLVIDALKVQIEEKYQPDYVLVDSRTGLTDVGGICTVHLADLLVIVTGLNRQNVDGTEMVVRNLHAARKDFQANVLFAVSPVPIGEEKLKEERLAYAASQFAAAMDSSEELLGKLLTVPYHPQVALTEDSFVKHHPDSPLAQAYRIIAESIRDRNPHDLPKLLSRIISRFEKGDAKAMPELLELAQRPRAPRDARLLAATFHYLSDELDTAEGLLQQLVSEDRQDPDSQRLWGDVVSHRAKSQQGTEADGLYELAGQKYAAALDIKPDKHEALNNWGNALSDQAKTKQGAEADGLYELAGQKYAAALDIKPDKHEALNNWGNALLAQAKTKQGAEADGLYELAGQKYAAALDIKPDKHEALNNWGNALSDQAKTKQGAEADGLYELAGQKYAAALDIKPDKHEALYNWGNALSDQAKTKQGAEADGLYELAGQKYAATLDIKPDQHEALHNWGNALSDQAKTKQGAEADGLFDSASEKYKKADELSNGIGAYNLACIAALHGKSTECQAWLEKSRATGNLPEKAHLEADTDLDPVRDEPWFREFLQSLDD